MATIKIDLGAIAGTGSEFAVADLTTIKIGAKTLAELGAVLSDDKKSITVAGYGVFSITGATAATFTADAALTGDYKLVDGGTVKITIGDFKAATGAVTVTGSASSTSIIGGAGNDSITTTVDSTTVVGGAGNDTITAGAFTATVTGGEGADKFVQTDAGKAFNVTDYNYAQGDTLVIKSAFSAVTAALASDGTFTDASTATVTASVAEVDGVYKAKVTDGAGPAVTKEFWTAKAAGSVVMDGSKVTDAMVIDATKAVASTVQGGFGDDAISLTGSQATLTVGKNNGHDTITGFDAGFNGDVLNLTGATLADIKWDTNSTIGATTLNGVGNATKGEILIQENGGAVKKVAYAAAAGQTFTSAKFDADVYLGHSSGSALDISTGTVEGAVVNLYDTDKYKNINNVKGAVAGGVYIGTADTTKSSVFDLTSADKASEVWGGSKADDTVSLKATNDVQDVVWFGTTDGNDSVDGFKAGFGEKSDVLYLYDVADVTGLKITGNTTNVSITAATGSVVDLKVAAVTNGTQLQLKDSAGNVKKLAVAVDDAVATIDGVGADMVIGKAEFARNVVTYDAKQKTDVVVNLFDTSIYQNINDVNLTNATGASNVVIGSADSVNGSKITLAGAAAEVWGGSKAADTITTGAGKDVIWFGAGDGADSVAAGFTVADDKVKFYDKSIGEIAKDYTWNSVASQFISKADATDSLELNGITTATLNIVDKDNKEAKAVIGAAALNYDKDAKVYMGAAASLTVNATEDVVLYLDNNAANPVNDIYFSGVTSINASNSTGQTVLIGNAAVGNQLIGGRASSAMWGGGMASDTMVGTVGSVDEFWFGAGDGIDSVNGADSADKVVLYGAASIDDITMTVNTNDFVITAKDGSILTVADLGNAALKGGITFQVGVNDAATSYTYDVANKQFVAK